MRARSAWLFLVGCVGVSGWVVAAPVEAQGRLTGTYIDYFSVSPDGWFINGSESMRYTEDGDGPYSCDAFYPGSPVEGFTFQGTGGGSDFMASHGSSHGISFTTTAPTTVSGRQITWSGSYTGAAGVALDVDQTVEYEDLDRQVHVTVVVSNTGTADITDLFYLRNADPDHASGCTGGLSSSTTYNDVIRQPPAADSALVTARAEFSDPVDGMFDYVLGIGAHDPRARVYAGGFANTDGRSEWMAPMDPDGEGGDIGVDVIFHEPALPRGGSTTFEFYYVWGLTVEDVETRFDDLGSPTGPCTGIPEGMACTTSSGASGLCRMGVCCTGCWDGMRCRGGRTADFCALGGTACRTCVDTDPCTLNVCTAGACSNPDAPTGSTCDDGLYCSASSSCDIMGRCVETRSVCDDMRTCTVDICNEMTRMCSYAMTVGCVIGGECAAPGAMHAADPCLVCDPMRSTTDWSPVAVGTACGREMCSGGRLTPVPTCNATGMCVAGPRTPCATMRCADTTSCAVPCAADADCAMGERCDVPTGRCEMLLGMGTTCTASTQCLSGACADGVCCDNECLGVCEGCRVPGTIGACSPQLAATDPDDDCEAPSTCDGARACTPLPDAGPPPDAGPIEVDAGPPPVDSGPVITPDAGPPDVDAGMRMGGGRDGGCGCEVPGAPDAGGNLGWMLLGIAGLWFARRRK